MTELACKRAASLIPERAVKNASAGHAANAQNLPVQVVKKLPIVPTGAVVVDKWVAAAETQSDQMCLVTGDGTTDFDIYRIQDYTTSLMAC